MHHPVLLAICTLGLLLPHAAHAQQAQERFLGTGAEAAEEVENGRLQNGAGWTPVRIAKWSSVGVAVAAAGVGLVSHERAADRFDALEATCSEQPERCGERLPGGEFADEELERLFQDVVELDRRARYGLIVSQAGIAAAVVLFILDMRGDSGPDNVPYDPGRLQLGPNSVGGLDLSVRLPLGVNRGHP